MDTKREEINELLSSELGLQTKGTSVRGVKVHRPSMNKYMPYRPLSSVSLCYSDHSSFTDIYTRISLSLALSLPLTLTLPHSLPSPLPLFFLLWVSLWGRNPLIDV